MIIDYFLRLLDFRSEMDTDDKREIVQLWWAAERYFDLVEAMFAGSGEAVLHGAGLYRQFHSSIHIDLEVVSRVTGAPEGDYGVSEDLGGHVLLNFALTLKPIYECFGSDFSGIVSGIGEWVKETRN